MLDNIILFVILYISGGYWLFRRYPRSIVHFGIKLFLILLFVLPMIVFFAFLRLSRSEIRTKMLSILNVNGSDIVRVYLASLIMLLSMFTMFTMFFIFEYYNIAFKYLEIRFILSFIMFIGIIETFIRYECKTE